MTQLIAVNKRQEQKKKEREQLRHKKKYTQGKKLGTMQIETSEKSTLLRKCKEATSKRLNEVEAISELLSRDEVLRMDGRRCALNPQGTLNPFTWHLYIPRQNV